MLVVNNGHKFIIYFFEFWFEGDSAWYKIYSIEKFYEW